MIEHENKKRKKKFANKKWKERKKKIFEFLIKFLK